MKLMIDLGAYRRNLDVLTRRLSPSRVMAVVKDDAYGHGRARIVQAALESGIQQFAVLDIETGRKLREDGVDEQIMLFAWLFDPHEQFDAAVAASIDLGISSVALLNRAAEAATRVGRAARVHLKIDSGLHRNGADPADWVGLVERAAYLSETSAVDVVGVWTHIGEASDEDDDASLDVFVTALSQADDVGLKPSMRHLAASAASFARPDFRFDMSRVGGFTFGIAPGSGLGPEELGLEPVMQAVATVTNIVGDGPTVTATLDAGYLDGIPRWSLPAITGDAGPLPRAGFDVSWRGRRFPIVDIGASTLSIDMSHAESRPQRGDTVVLFGSHLRDEPVLQEWADALGTVGEEIVVRVGARAPREYLD